MSKRVLSLVLAFTMILGSFSFVAAETDFAGHWAEKDIEYLMENDIIKGFPDGSFKPGNKVTRAQLATIINGALELTDAAEIDFSDVNEGAWYYDAIAIAVEAGYMDGYPDGTMNPNGDVKRQEAAKMFVEAFGVEESEAELDFNDADKIQAWAVPYVKSAVAAGLMSGHTSGNFAPLGTLIRAEAARMTINALGIDLDEAEELEVVSVSAIDEDGVTVVIEATTEDIDEATVEVLDNEGNVVATKSELVAEGQTEVTFDFVTPFSPDYDFEGVWSVNGVEYNFDAIAQFEAIQDAVENENEVELLAALQDAGIENVDEDLITKYFEAIDEDNEAEDLADIQELINEANKEAGKEVDEEAAAKAVNEAKNQVQLLNALTANFERVNKDWIVAYDNALDGNQTYDDIQTAVDEANKAQIDNVKPANAKEQAAKTALIEAWMKPDTTTPKVTAKAEAIEASKLAEAAFKVVEANTANRLYNALVAFADLAKDEAAGVKIDTKVLKEENKQFYYDVVNPAEGQYEVPEAGITAAPANIVEKGNQDAEDAQDEINKRIAVTEFRVENTEVYDSTAKGEVRLLGYWVAVDVNADADADADARTVGGTESIVIELYDGETLLGKQSLNATGYEKHSDKSSIGGTIDAYGEYVATSWDHEWYGELTDIPTKAVATVTYKDGAVAEAVKEEAPTGNTDVFKDQLVADLVEVIKESEDVAETEQALVDLANLDSLASFLATPTADRTYVAEAIVAETDTVKEGWTNVAALNNYIEGKNTAINVILDNVNDLSKDADPTESNVKTALTGVKAYDDLTEVQKTDVARAFLVELNALKDVNTFNFKSYTELSTFVEGLI